MAPVRFDAGPLGYQPSDCRCFMAICVYPEYMKKCWYRRYAGSSYKRLFMHLSISRSDSHFLLCQLPDIPIMMANTKEMSVKVVL